MTLLIRPLRPDDRDQWMPLWLGYLDFYETKLPDEVSETTFARLCDPARLQQRGLVAEKDGRLVGMVNVVFHAHNWKREDVTYLQDLFATLETRGTGVGRALIEAVYRLADENGTPTVYWMTQEFNATARQLYDRVGTLTPFIRYQR
ncbi:GNAT family N-acetyltransferase [Maritimibacter sp. DP1N21-5]|uniref:GNAT family N-acetyltransferase n=1 Tax=Maritimibacter sp. DP1N21-5 TaxID=2836867 RepID=UPI001C45FD43|nr:GNAT family N-acetyltransferase [Maritimibacter sp. DP1N21-5]MBV7407876.1 GNAT family N-acetyltransferase [Maritimibacter sp. DP1N21-5]